MAYLSFSNGRETTHQGEKYPCVTVEIIDFSPDVSALYNVKFYVNEVDKQVGATGVSSFSSLKFDIIFNNYNTNYKIEAKITKTYDESWGTRIVSKNYTTIKKPSGGGGSGSIEPDQPDEPEEEIQYGCYIWNEKEWKSATLYIWNGSTWKKATPYIWNGTNWMPTTIS